jgi:hypothetical protein
MDLSEQLVQMAEPLAAGTACSENLQESPEFTALAAYGVF